MRDELLSWMRMVAAQRCGDRKKYEAELAIALRELPGFEIANLLHGRTRGVAG
jgi:hypothetical protein